MAECPNCGVTLADSAKHCPLCRAAIHAAPQAAHAGEGAGTAPYPERALDPEDFEAFSPADKRKIFLEVFSICTLIACLVVLAVDFLTGGGISWSLYPVSSLVLLYVLVCAPFLLYRRPWILLAVLAPACVAFIFVIDLLASGLSWFLPVGLPIALIVEASALSCVVLSAASKQKGVNIISLALIGVSAACVGIETVINLNFAPRFFLFWSSVVATVCLPIAGFLFYLHYRINKRASLKKLFRL